MSKPSHGWGKYKNKKKKSYQYIYDTFKDAQDGLKERKRRLGDSFTSFIIQPKDDGTWEMLAEKDWINCQKEKQRMQKMQERNP